MIAGLVFGWVRSVHPTFGFIPEPTVWFINSFGLNIFIAVLGLTVGPNFVAGLKQSGLILFMWGVAATSLPLMTGPLIGRYLFKFHPAIIFGCCAGARDKAGRIMKPSQAKASPICASTKCTNSFDLIISKTARMSQ